MMFYGSIWKPKRHQKIAEKKQGDVFALALEDITEQYR